MPVRRLEINCALAEVNAASLSQWLERQRAVSESPAGSRSGGGRSLEEWVDAERVHLPLVVRTRSPGERLWPLGAPGSKKLSEFLRDAKVEPLERDRVAVLCDRLGPITVIQASRGNQFQLDHFSSLDDVRDSINKWAKQAGDRLEEARGHAGK